MEDKILNTPATLEGVALRKDGSATLRFSTQELAEGDLAIVQKFHGHFGTLLFSEAEIQPKDIPKHDPDFDGKTPSQRLRAVIFVLYSHLKGQGQTTKTFEEFYGGQIEAIIEQYKSKLPPQD